MKKSKVKIRDGGPKGKLLATQDMFEEQTLPPFFFLHDHTVGERRYLRGEEYDPYLSDYQTLVDLFKNQLISNDRAEDYI